MKQPHKKWAALYCLLLAVRFLRIAQQNKRNDLLSYLVQSLRGALVPRAHLDIEGYGPDTGEPCRLWAGLLLSDFLRKAPETHTMRLWR